MAEQQSGNKPEAGSGWLNRKGGGGGYRPPYVLSFDKNQKHIIRIMDKSEPLSVWRHTARTMEGRFTMAFCRGDFDNVVDKCPLCLVNSSEKYRDLKGKDRPFPKGSEYVKAVWSYDDNKPMLLVGNDVWRKIDGILATGVDIFKYDITVSRVDEQDKPTSYGVSILPDRVIFDKVVDPSTIPLATDYEQWLKDNLAKVSITVPANVGAGGALGRDVDSNRLAGFAANTNANEAKAPVTPVVETVVLPAGGATNGREAAKAKFGVMLSKGWNSALIQQLMEEINGRRKLVDSNAKLANDLESLTDSEYMSFVDMYGAAPTKK